LDYESPYEAKLKEYEQRLTEIDKELLGKTEEVEELVDAETEELPSSKPLPAERESRDSEEQSHVQTDPSKSDLQPRLASMTPQAKPAKNLQSRLLDSKKGNQSIEDAKWSNPDVLLERLLHAA